MREFGALLRNRCSFAAVLVVFTLLHVVVGLLLWELPFAFEVGWWFWIAPAAAVLTALSALLLRGRYMPPQGFLWRLLLITLVFNLVGNPMFCASPLAPGVALLMGMGAICLLWALLGRLSAVFWVPFVFVEMAQIVAFFQYGTRFNSLVLAESLEASPEEIMAYVNPVNVILACLALALVVVLVRWLCRTMRGQSRLSLLCFGTLSCTLAQLCEVALPPHHQSAEQHLWPFCEVVYLCDSYQEAIEHNIAVVSLAEGLTSPADEPSSCEFVHPDSGIVFVLHIGESVRADAMSINGYGRDTTPWLRRQPRVINFPDCISCVADTCQAQIVLLTDARRGIHDATPGMQPTTGSVLDLLHKHGFEVFSFFGQRCGQQLKYDRVVRILTRISTERFNAPGSPWEAVPQIKRVLDEHPGENLAFFVNNEGSHTPFSHFDHDNPPFAPANADFQNPEAHADEIRNAYDSTIHYTDEYWRRVCELLKGRPFVYLYVSDHGEYLGQDGIWGRGGLGNSKMSYLKTTGCRVGMFVITSPELEALHPHFAEAIRQLQSHTQMTVAQEHVFHTILGLFGIETKFYNPELDLCNPQVRPYEGEKPDVPAPGLKAPAEPAAEPAEGASDALPEPEAGAAPAAEGDVPAADAADVAEPSPAPAESSPAESTAAAS